ncbi:MAG: ATP-binding protein, partial [Verrucomicrobiia bacterium]
MNGVIGLTSVLSETELTAEQRDYVDTIANSGAALMSILNDILDFSKIEAGRMTVEDVDFSVEKFLTEASALWKSPMVAKGLEFRTINHVPDVLEISADRTKLQQIVNNLVGNAAKFTPAGEIELSVHEVHRAGNQIEFRFEVRDTGIGIPQDRADMLFQPFTQADSSTTRKYGGTGLGLSISKALVERMGGEIGFDSVAGQGTVFWFTIAATLVDDGNVAQDKPTLTRDAGRTLKSGQRLRVLLAEDNETNQKVIEAMMHTFNADVDVVENGVEAVMAIKKSDYDLILMDVQMPIMDGVEATKEIRALGGEKGMVPIIALTG